MVVEDLHWADAALVEFLEDLLVWAAGAPIMVICTARPELYEAQPGWGGGRRNSTTISLAPLTDHDLSRLLVALLDQAVLPAATQRALLDRAGGNPLYAEEFVRMLNDRGMVQARGGLDLENAAAIPVPETVQALIGSRLDVLPDDEARVIEDASVVGKVFWEGALQALGGSDDVAGALRSLVAREWVRPVRSSTVESQREYAFWHALTRDVAYGRIPRAARARKHRTMAQWMESIASERSLNHAELLAHHFGMALAYAEASGEPDTDTLKGDTIRALTMAGERALRLDSSRAHGYYQRALDLIDEDDARRPRLLMKAGIAAEDAGTGSAAEVFEEAAGLAEAGGDQSTAGWALTMLHRARWFESGTGAGTEDIERAIELLESRPPSQALADAYVTRSGDFLFRGLVEQQLEWAQKGIELAEALGLDAELMRGLEVRGMGRFHRGDVEGGMSDLRRSLRIAEERAPTARRLETAHVNLADHTWFAVGPAAALDIYRRGVERVEARGSDTTWSRAETMWVNFDLGRWDELLETADDLLSEWGEQRTQFVPWAQSYRAAVHVWRGDPAEAAALQSEYLPVLRDIGDLQLLAPGLLVASRTEITQGNAKAAAALVTEYLEVTEDKSPIYRAMYGTEAARLLVAAGLEHEAREMVATLDTSNLRARIGVDAARGILAETQGEHEAALASFTAAAQNWHDYGFVLEEALAHQGAARCLTVLGRADEAADAVHAAEEILTRLRVGADERRRRAEG